jgi:hypothetical protein
MKIYIACGLTHIPRQAFPRYVAFIHGLANHIEQKLSAEVRYALKDSDPQLAQRPPQERARLCYLWDRAMVEWADVVVAECSYPSTGLGIELQIAEQKNTPIIICYEISIETKASPIEYINPDAIRHELQIGEGYVTLMALGIPSVFRVMPYTSNEQGFTEIGAAVALINRT